MRVVTGALLVVASSGCGAPAPVATERARAPIATERERACVDPIDDTRSRFGGLEDVPVDVDLDGHGPADRALPLDGYCGSGGCTYALYVMGGACGRFVGTVTSSEIDPADAFSNGLRQLRLAFYGGSCSWTEQRAAYDGREYVVLEERDCRCVGYGPNEPEPPAECGRMRRPARTN
jgi:hypothetical protein